MFRTVLQSSIALLLLFSSSTNCLADLTGDQIFSVFEAPIFAPGENLWDDFGGATTLDPLAAIVGPGVEYFVDLGGTPFLADVGADSIEFGFDFPASTLIGDDILLSFTSLDGGNPIDGVAIESSDFDIVQLGFTSDSISIVIPDQGYDVDNPRLNLSISFVPEPSSATVIGLAFVALVARRRR